MTSKATLGVIGAGAMGQGIIQVALSGGMTVQVFDAKPGGAAAGIEAVQKRLARLVEKGRIDEAELTEIASRTSVANALRDLGGCDVIIEAVFEDLELKQQIFSELEEHVSDDCIIASNTSSILISSIARACRHRERIAGMHFFNPVPLMQLVEIIRGPETSSRVAERLSELGTRMGRTPVVVKDSPGFLVNHGGRAYTTEAIRILHERVATPAQIDAVMRDCHGFRMGPCELMDLTGIDVNFPVSQIVYDGYAQDPRLRTFFPHKALYEAGRFGRKTKAGHYDYDEDGKAIGADGGDFETDHAPATRLIVPPEPARNITAAFAREIGCTVAESDDSGSPILVSLAGEDCATYAARTNSDHERLVAIDLRGRSDERVTLMTAPGARPECLATVAAAIIAAGRRVTAIKDSPGFIAQRICAMVANLGCEMAQIGVAAPDEIDLALKLGLNYPRGPLEIAEDFGVRDMLEMLETMQDITGDDRYRPSLWLRRRALLGLPCHTPN